LRIDELVVPTSVDGVGWADFERAIDVGNIVEAVTYGTTDLAYTAAEELPYYRNTFQPRRTLVARVGGKIVGRATYETQTGESADTGWVSVEVLAEYRGRGVGRALAERVEAVVAQEGKLKAIAYIGIQDVDGPRLPSPTGFGSVPLANRDVKFLIARGYSFEQVERLSRLALPVPALRDLVSAATVASGPEYRVVTWHGRTPEKWRGDIAILGTRMSTDAPSAGLEEPEDIWTVERVLEGDDRAEASGLDRLVAAVEHVPTGALVGYTMLAVPPNPTRAVAQYATLVLREHRGHRLGMLLKVANLVHLERVHPGRPSVTTFNAEENRYMLDVNEAVGFVGIGFEAAWRKDM
jgi:GNAT superfamily N-acetyltransferase